MEYKDYYKLMGLERSASSEAIKAAYRKLARKYHPDKNKAAGAEEKFKEIGEAYAVLGDEEKRRRYDELGANWQTQQEFRPPPGWHFRSSGRDHAAFGSDQFSDFFQTLFGQRDFSFGGARHSGGDEEIPGKDVHNQVSLTLEEAYQGVSRTVQLSFPEVMPDGTTHTKKRTLNIKIPAGVVEGQRIRLAGQGYSAGGRAAAGDLYLEILFQKHRLFRADGADIYLTLPVTPWEIALGAKILVPTLAGQVELKIPAGSQSGQQLRLSKRGLPAKKPGDQYVILQVVLPKADTEEAKNLYREMASALSFNPRKHMES